MYFVARYRLQFTDDEFWLSTPAKLSALLRLMNERDGAKKEPVLEATAGNLFV